MEQIKETSLKFSESPLCPIAADVISDGESIYFYMYDLDFENERLIARSACWVKNLVEAPLSFQKDKIDEDHQPVLPAMFVDEDMDIKPWNEDELEIVWSKEGHIAGLLHNNDWKGRRSGNRNLMRYGKTITPLISHSSVICSGPLPTAMT